MASMADLAKYQDKAARAGFGTLQKVVDARTGTVRYIDSGLAKSQATSGTSGYKGPSSAIANIGGTLGTLSQINAIRSGVGGVESLGGGAGGGGIGGAGGSGVTGSTIPSSAQSLMDEYQNKLNEANAANEARYQQILGGYDKRYGDVISGLEGAGTQAAKDISQRSLEASAQGKQGMVDTGLYNSTIAPTMQMGYDREKESALGNLEESIRQQRLGYMSNMQKEKLDFMERRTDQAPDPGLYSQLISQYGQGVGGAGGGTAGGWAGFTPSGGSSGITAGNPMFSGHRVLTADELKAGIKKDEAEDSAKQPTFKPSATWNYGVSGNDMVWDPIKKEYYSRSAKAKAGQTAYDNIRKAQYDLANKYFSYK